MKQLLNILVLILDLFGLALFVVAYIGLKRLLKEQRRLSIDAEVSAHELKRFKKYTIIMLAGFATAFLTSLVKLIALLTR